MLLNEEGIRQFAAVVPDDLYRAYMIPLLCAALRMQHAVAFCNSRGWCDVVQRSLARHNLSASVIDPDTPQAERDEAVNDFRKYYFNLLIVHGPWPKELPAQDVNLVFNYDLPPNGDVYAEQVGPGCDRAGLRQALVITLVRDYQMKNLEALAESCPTKIYPLGDEAKRGLAGLFDRSFPIPITRELWEFIEKTALELDEQVDKLGIVSAVL